MKNNDEDRILRVLLEQNIINDIQAEAYLTYQESTEQKTGSRLPLDRVMEKLGILSRDQINSLLKAMDMNPPPASRIPMSAPSSSVDSTLDNMRGDKPSKIAPWSARRGGIKTEDQDEPHSENTSLPPPKLTPALLEAKATLGLDKPTLGEKPSLGLIGEKPADKLTSPIAPSLPRPSLQEAANAVDNEILGATHPRHRLGVAPSVPSNSDQIGAKDSSPEDVDTNKKSLLCAYFLLITTGIFGGHRFYIRSYTLGFWYLFTLGFCGLGLLADLFLLPLIFKRINNEIQAGISESIWKKLATYEPYTTTNSLPTWVEKDTAIQKLGAFLEGFLRLVYLVISPIALGIIAMILWQPMIPFVFLLWLTLFLGNAKINKALSSNPALQHIPFLSLFNKKITQFTGFYFENKPTTILFYLFYPLWLPFAVIISEKRREEASAILWVLMLGLGWLVSSLASSAVMLSFQINIATQNFLLLNAFIGLASMWLFLMLSMPTWISLASMKLKQQSIGTAFFGGWAWLVQFTVLVFLLIGPHFFNCEPYVKQDSTRSVMTKLQLPEYRGPANKIIAEFITATTNPKPEKFDTSIESEYTKNIQLRLAGLFPGKETSVFHVRYLSEQPAMVLFAGNYPLVLWDHQGQSVAKWDDLLKKEGYTEALKKSIAIYLAWPEIECWRQYLDVPLKSTLPTGTEGTLINDSNLKSTLWHHEILDTMLDDIPIIEEAVKK